MMMEAVNTGSVLLNGAESTSMPILTRRPFTTEVSLSYFNKTFIIAPKSS
jgi:hypothetical protein